MTAHRDGAIPVLELTESPTGGEDELGRLLREAQRLIFKYPIASQAVIAAFVAEGRRFSETAEGQAWRIRLARSDLYQRGKEIWYLGTLGIFGEKSPGVLPSAMVEAFIQATSRLDLDAVLAFLTRRRAK